MLAVPTPKLDELPPDTLLEIIEKLPQSDILNLRHVSKTLKEGADATKFSITLSGLSLKPKLVFLGDIKIENLKMIDTLKNRVKEKGFPLHKPWMLKTLRATGGNDSELFLSVVFQAQALRKLDLAGFLRFRAPFNIDVELIRTQLTKIVLWMDPKPQNRSTTLQILSKMFTPNLRELGIRINVGRESEFLTIFLQFLRRIRPGQLKHLEIQLVNGPVESDLTPELGLDKLASEMTEIGKSQNLKGVGLMLPRNRRNTFWNNLLQSQTSLEHFKILDEYFDFSPSQLQLNIPNLISTNSRHLVTTQLFTELQDFDFRSFEGCVNLRSVGLGCTAFGYGTAANFDLRQQTSNVEKLGLTLFRLNEAKLENILGLQNLTHLVLFSPEMEIAPRILEHLWNNPSLVLLAIESRQDDLVLLEGILEVFKGWELDLLIEQPKQWHNRRFFVFYSAKRGRRAAGNSWMLPQLKPFITEDFEEAIIT